MTIRSILLGLLAVPFTMLSQQDNHSLFVEAGSSVYIPQQRSSHEADADLVYPESDFHYTYKTAAASYVNIGFEQKLAGKKRLTLSLPLAIGFRSQREVIQRTGFYNGDFGAQFKGTETFHYNNHFTSSVLGLKLNYTYGKLTYFLACNLHTELLVMQVYKDRAVSSVDGSARTSKEYTVQLSPDNMMLNISLQTGFMYRFNPKWSAGLTVDSYLYNLNPLLSQDPLKNHLFNLSCNTGVRISRWF